MNACCIVNNGVLAAKVLHKALVPRLLHVDTPRVHNTKDCISLLRNDIGVNALDAEEEAINVVTLLVHLDVLCLIARPQL